MRLPKVYFAALRYSSSGWGFEGKKSSSGWGFEGKKIGAYYDKADKLRPGLLDVFFYRLNLSLHWYR